ncbi:lipopolysaccharide biosynthesis protein [Pseudarthrobacter sulfonivorans]|uniref:lipopolysaccharide biosynthesis protein n=1 Tax=Pseudarthrobacter sulfonivorans TaxID=121292 RepID=UPI0027D89D18|nr:oligosaccharide flippase family protein [Pseudarthrobacter sulfonivorans]
MKVMRGMGSKSPLLRRFAGFTFVPLVGTLAPLLLLPIAARVGGIDGWYSLSVGQAVGTFGSIVISYGWNVLGPALVATTSAEESLSAHWAESLRERLLLAAIVVPIAALISVFLASPEYVGFTMAMAVAFSLGGLTPNWYFIGRGDPTSIALYDMLPKLVATLLTALIIFMTGSLWAYPALWILSSLVGLLAAHRSVGYPPIFRGSRISTTLRGLRKRLGVAMIDGLGGVYISAPVPIAGATGSIAGAGMIASADKLYRFGLIAVTTLGNTLQAWTLEPDAPNPRNRHLGAILAHTILGVIGMCGLGLLGEFATSLLFGAEAKATGAAMWYYGIAFLAVSSSTPLIRNLLVPAFKTRFVLAGTSIGALVGVASMFVLGNAAGPEGVALGFMISELVLLFIIAPASVGQLLLTDREASAS